MKKSFLILLLAAALLCAGCGKGGADAPPAPTATPTPTATPSPAPTAEPAAAPATEAPVDVWADYMTALAAEAERIRTALTEEAVTQLDMNEKSRELYELWDGALNELWAELKTRLPEEEYAPLLDEQLAWIQSKEAAVEAAGQEYAGGSMAPLAMNSKAAQLTEERVYRLYALLQEAGEP